MDTASHAPTPHLDTPPPIDSAPIPGPEHHRASRLRRATTAVTLASSLALSGAGCASFEAEASPTPMAEVSATALYAEDTTASSILSQEEIDQLAATYPEAQNSAPTSPEKIDTHTYDVAASNPHMTVYRHKGLDTVSFGRPSYETNLGVVEAKSLPELQTKAQPYFASFGIDLRLGESTRKPLIADGIQPVTNKQLAESKQTVIAAMQVFATTPREAIAAAHIDELLLADKITYRKDAQTDRCTPQDPCNALGMAYMFKDNAPTTIALNVHTAPKEKAAVVHHEFSHALANAIDKKTGTLYVNIAGLNPPGFAYERTATENGMTPNEYEPIAARAVKEHIVTDPNGAADVIEDIAEIYTTLTDPNEFGSAGSSKINPATPAAKKQIALIEHINRHVHGFKDYIVGRFLTKRFFVEEPFSSRPTKNTPARPYQDAPDIPKPKSPRR